MSEEKAWVEARRRKQFVLGTIGVILLAMVTAAVMRLEPAAPKVDRATIYTDSVRQGEMLRQVRGPGTLVPLEIRWIASRTEGRVEQRVILPGAEVEPETVIVILSNPELEQLTQDAELALRRAEAEYADRQVALESQLLNERAAYAAVESEYQQASLQAQANETSARRGSDSGADREALATSCRPAREPHRDREGAPRVQCGVGQEAARVAACGSRAGSCSLRPASVAARGPRGPSGHHRRPAAGAGRGRPAGHSGHQSRSRRSAREAEGRAAHQRDPGQGHSQRTAGHGRHAQRCRRGAGSSGSIQRCRTAP